MSSDPETISRQQRRARERQAEKQAAKTKLQRGAAITLGAAALVGAPVAEAATFTVINLNDAGAGSLRQAVIDANAAAGADIVEFQAGLTGTITLTTGQISIGDSVDIQGPGSTNIEVNGNATSRIFYLYAGSGLIDVTISGLELANGGGVTFGGAVINFGENLLLDEMVISGCVATAGGGAVAGTDLSGDGMQVTIRNSALSGNDSGRDGGAIYFYTTGGPMVIEGSQVTGNETVDDGGGIYLYNITDDLSINGSTISGNTTGDLGGGVYFYQTDGGVQTIDHGIVADNNAVTGGGLMGVFFDTPFTINQSTFSGNSAATGGGIFTAFAFGAPVRVVNSTISGNLTTDGGGGIFLYSLYAGGTMAIENSTLAGNSAGTATGGGLFTLAESPVVRNSILGDNTPDDVGTGAEVGSIDVAFSLIETVGGAVIVDSGGNNLGVDAQLAPLSNNGGATLTHKPALTSPAVNDGDPAFVPPPATDQRDLPRVVNTVIDMGAVELGLAGTIQLTFAAADVGEADGAITITATRTGGSEGAVSVTLNSADGSAVSPADFAPVVAAVLNWGDLDTNPKTYDITIVDDPDVEGNETFTVTLSNPTGGATLGAPAAATITIIDNDVAPEGSVLEIPTLGSWSLALFAALIGAAGIYRSRRGRGLAAPMLAITLAAGSAAAANAADAAPADAAKAGSEKARPAAAATVAPAAGNAGNAGNAAAPIRQAYVGTLSQVLARAESVSLQLAGGTLLDAPRNVLEIKDRRGKRLNPDLRSTDLAPGQAVILKVRRNQEGAIQKVRVAVFDNLEEAQAAQARHAN